MEKEKVEEAERERVVPRLARPRDSSRVLLVWGSPLSATLLAIPLELSIRKAARRRHCHRLRLPRRRHGDVFPSIPRAAYDRARPTGINRAPRCHAHVFTPRGCDSAVPLTVAVAAWPRRLGARPSCVCVWITYVSLSFSPLALPGVLQALSPSLYLSLQPPHPVLPPTTRGRHAAAPRSRPPRLPAPLTVSALARGGRSPLLPRAIKYHESIDSVIFYRYF